MKVLVTGGSGFIGSHLIDALLKREYKITNFDRAKALPKYPNWQKISHIQGDIKDRKNLSEVIGTADVVFHLAGLLGTEETFERIDQALAENINGAVNIFEVARKHSKKLIFLTIGSVDWLNPYAITKLAAERFCLMYNKELGSDFKAVRGLNTYGPRQKHEPVRKVVPNFVISAILNKPLKIFGDGQQELDLVYIEDLIEVLLRTMDYKGKLNHVLEAGTGKTTSVNDLARLIIKMTASKSSIEYAPIRKGEPFHSITLGDPKTLEKLAYRPQTTLEIGLQASINWYKQFLKSYE